MTMASVQFWHWLVLGIACFTLEVFAPGAILMWFGFGALVTGFLLWLIPGLDLGWQLLSFALVSASAVLVWRRSPWFREEATPSDHPMLNNRLQGYIGRDYVLSEAIRGGRGLLRVGDSAWRVSGPDLAAGTRVRVTGVDGIILLVERCD